MHREEWFRMVTGCASRARNRFGTPDPDTAERMVRAFRAALRPRKAVGRRPNDATVRAAEMWIAGVACYPLTHPRQPFEAVSAVALAEDLSRGVPGFGPHGQTDAGVPDQRAAAQREILSSPRGVQMDTRSSRLHIKAVAQTCSFGTLRTRRRIGACQQGKRRPAIKSAPCRKRQ